MPSLSIDWLPVVAFFKEFPVFSSRSSKSFIRGLAALLAVTTLLRLGPSTAAPADIYSMPGPGVSAQTPKPKDIEAGDASVSTQTGAMTYRYPIKVPPGRHVAPSLALSYSSQAPIYGGVAAGWSLEGPHEIRYDTSRSILRYKYAGREQTQELASPGSASLDDRFVSSLAGGRPLVPVTEPAGPGVIQTFRAQNDSGFFRYQRMNPSSAFRWRVLTPDGTTFLFGESARVSTLCNVSDGNAPLTSMSDSFGNEVSYTWAVGVDGECRLSRIRYGQNCSSNNVSTIGTATCSESAGALPFFATIDFNYSLVTPCGGIYPGSQTDFRGGIKRITGASRLDNITITAHPPGNPNAVEHTRVITLGYDSTVHDCTRKHAPFRLLSSIQEKAWGADAPLVNLPAVTFGYGTPEVSLDTGPTYSDAPWAFLSSDQDLSWGKRFEGSRWPTVEAMFVDIDGDGLVDRLTNASNPTTGDGRCRARWQRNTGAGFEQSAPREILLPQLKWHNAPAGSMNGSITASDESSPPDPDGRVLREGCALNGQVTDYRNMVDLTPSNQGTYLAYRWMDMDGDGLTDLVAAIHAYPQTYDPERGNAFPDPTTGETPAEPPIFGAWPSCNGPQPDKCRAPDHTCMNTARSSPLGSPNQVNWGTVNACLAVAPEQGCYAQTANEASTFYSGPVTAPSTPTTDGFRFPYERCNGLYPWFIYKNHGNGAFASTPVIKYQPAPLESDTGDSALHGSAIASGNHGVLDFDGDGLLDIVVRSKNWWWYVWLGDGTGGVGPERYVFEVRTQNNQVNGVGTNGVASGDSSVGLVDLNGDGLPEHWVAKLDSNNRFHANVAVHAGLSLRLVSESTGEYDTVAAADFAVKPGDDATTDIIEAGSTGQPPKVGLRRALTRLIDIDQDGRVDVARLGTTPSNTVHYNFGGQFDAAQGIAGISFAFNRAARVVTPQQGSNIPGYWYLKQDAVDLDGDGIPETYSWTSDTTPPTLRSYKHDVVTEGPPRLLTRIGNGRGGEVSIAYDSMHSATVVQSSGERWTDKFAKHAWQPDLPEVKRTKTSSQNQWVVKSLTFDDSVANTHSTTNYLYKHPRHGRDDEGRFSFRGFEHVVATSPSGSKTTSTYDYSVDWSGRLRETAVQAAESTFVHSWDATTWQELGLFGGAIKTYHATLSERATCKSSQTRAACTPEAAAAYSRTTTTLCAITANEDLAPCLSSQPVEGALLWQATRSLLQAATTDADGDRETISTFRLHSDGTNYRLRSLTSTRNHRVSGAMTMFGKTASTYDLTYRVPSTSEVWVDSVDTNRAITGFEYDLQTGNQTKRWKPRQYASTGPALVSTYDVRKLFVASDVDEAGHERRYDYHYGTGTKLRTHGPNARTCTPGPSCIEDALHPVLEQHGITIDGLGRQLSRWETTSTDGNYFELKEFERTSYVDNGIPNSITQETRITETGTWRKEMTELDGQGRVKRAVVYVQGSAPSDEVTSYEYRDDGTLKQVNVPDPTANDATMVSYTYSFDSLGRLTGLRRPAPAMPAVCVPTNQSGIDVTYDGVTKTTREFLVAGDGVPAATATTSDAFGRLVEVREQTGATTWATTTYEYGPDDIVTRITSPDPEVLPTELVHDFAGHRTRITRAGRSWEYVYDKNGNVEAEISPCEASCSSAENTSTTLYDDLDRPISKVLATRGLSTADLDLFASSTELFTWDVGRNHKGHLTSWQSFGASSSTPALKLHDDIIDGQGRVTGTRHLLTIAGYQQLERRYSQTWTYHNQKLGTHYLDYLGGSDTSQAQYQYDARGLPSHINAYRMPSGSSQAVGVQTRNVAGLVTKRKTNLPGNKWVESNWSFDKLGRVTSQVVQKGPTITPVVRQDICYFGNDDPKQLDHHLGLMFKRFAYEYDYRHQLTDAIETTVPGYYTGEFAYSPAGRLLFAAELSSVAPSNGVPQGSDLKPRTVDYQYDDADKERPTRLSNGDGSPFATYTYDAAGNQGTRCYGSTSPCLDLTEYTYDGRNQLRRVRRTAAGAVAAVEEYWYDQNGSRVAIVKKDAAGLNSELIWFIGEGQAHYDGTGNLTKVYSHPSLGTTVTRIERVSNTQTKVEHQFHGLASSTIAAVSTDGTVNAAMSHTPFGSLIEATSDATLSAELLEHPRRFNDKYHDAQSQLVYYGARYYDPTALTWTQSDPLYRFEPDAAWSDPRRSLLYTITLNNPLRYIDPDGRDAVAALGRVVVGGASSAELGPAALGVMLGLGAWEVGKAVSQRYVPIWQEVTPTEIKIGPSDPPPISPPRETQTAKNDPAPPPPPIEAGRGNRGNRKGERGHERKNPNPRKHEKYRQRPDGSWEKKDHGTGKWRPSPPPPNPVSGGAEFKRADDGAKTSQDGSSQDDETSERGESPKARPFECGIECNSSFR